MVKIVDRTRPQHRTEALKRLGVKFLLLMLLLVLVPKNSENKHHQQLFCVAARKVLRAAGIGESARGALAKAIAPARAEM